MEYRHIPVMLEEALEYLNLQTDGLYIDCTLGGAGYTAGIAARIGNGKVVSIDLDKLAIENAKKKLKEKNLNNVIIVNDNFRNLTTIVEENLGQEAIGRISGVVLDLGLSSAQLEDRSRGFSFQADTPLEMGFAQVGDLSTETIINTWSEEELAKIFWEYGEEKFARKIAKKIVSARNDNPIRTTGQLVEVIKSSLPAAYLRKKGIHFATLVFQALRIATNDELVSLQQVLEQSIEVLAEGGRVVVISYHSLEDRMVKRFFKQESIDCICPPDLPICQCDHPAKLKILTKKVILPSAEEVESNPRSRSAKLRAAEKIQ